MRFKDFLAERRYESLPNGDVVFLNPTIDELNSLHTPAVRGFIDENGNVFIWRAYGGTHEEVSKYIGEKVFVAFALARTSENKARSLDLNPKENWKIMLARYSTPSGMLKNGEQILVNNRNIERMLMGKPELISV